jgi:phage terminase small subunit
MNRIDKEDLMQVEKVERYVYLVQLFNDLEKDIKEHGRMVVTENGAQKFTKPNPAISEKVKINTAILHIEKTFGFTPVATVEEESGLL